MFKSKHFLLILILLLGFLLRLYGINWDNGFHLHPDERMLIMVADRINFFEQLNPYFFNYGSLPIYLLKGISQAIDFLFSTQLANYQGMLYLGRFLSITADIITLFLIYKIGELLFKNEKIALFSSFFYAITFFPIQNSHFFISDVFLTTFVTILCYLLLGYLNNSFKQKLFKDDFKIIVFFGINFAAMLATKFTAIIFLPITIILFLKKAFNYQLKIKRLVIDFLLFNFSLLTFSFLFMPYTFLDFKKFFQDVSLQIKMNSNPYIFPYTLQYIDTFPYFYYLKNIFLWGMGPIISFLSIFGIISLLTSKLQLKKLKIKAKSQFKTENFFISIFQFLNFLITNKYFLFFLFYFFYFLIIGRSAVKFMRYMLPLYPFLAIMAGYGLNNLRYQNSKIKFLTCFQKNRFKILDIKFNTCFLKLVKSGIAIAALFWTLMFINIYSRPNTRIFASEWIIKNIPTGSILAVEHWDDKLPLYGSERYNFLELNLYDQPDDEIKWQRLNEKLNKTDYIIIASNRLYVPLQKLTDCQKHKICYPKTAEYYKKLFNNQLPFIKVAEFFNYPHLKIGKWKLEINDHSADESFTVYDHPKIIIFKRLKKSL